MIKQTLIIVVVILCAFNSSIGQDSLRSEIPLQIDVSSGFYYEPVVVSLFAPGANIYYTIDGRRPSRKSKKYRRPLLLKKTTTLRAIALRGKNASQVITQTYFINEPMTDMPVASLSIDPNQLYNKNYGLFRQGAGADTSKLLLYGANYWSKREVPANIEYFEPNQTPKINQKVGFRVFGGISRTFPQKSFSLSARDKYGDSRFRYKMFGEDGPKKIKHLVFRNSGSDWGRSNIRDVFITSLVADWGLEYQKHVATTVYINGTYWGIYNIREKVNRFFIDDYYDLHRDSVDIIEGQYTRKAGTSKYYIELLKWAKDKDFSIPENYNALASKVDIDNFIDYFVTQIFINNRDAGGNIKYWKPQDNTSKWRTILYDTDWGFGLHSSRNYKENSFEFYTESDGPKYPNPPWSTFWLRSLLENEDVKIRFINRFADRLNTTFQTKNMLAHLEDVIDNVDPDIERHLKRWRKPKSRWEKETDKIKTFAKKRPKYIYRYITEFFEAGDTATLELASFRGGYAVINENITVNMDTFSGRYFENVPITINAYPEFGHRFLRWVVNDSVYYDKQIKILLNSDKKAMVYALFEKYDNPNIGSIIINEICNSDKISGDWVELYNATQEIINVGNWVLADARHDYRIPNTLLLPNEYLVICEDTAAFKAKYQDQSFNIVGNIPFGISKRKEFVALYDDDGASVDSLSYHLEPLDTSYTLSLKLPTLNNENINSWELRVGNGTPNAPNPYYTHSKILQKQSEWMKIGSTGGLILVLAILLFWKRKKRQLGIEN